MIKVSLINLCNSINLVQVNILNKAKETLEKAGIEPKKVSLKTLVPILEYGSLEEEESMSNRWSGLLAAAASSEGSEASRPCFAEILKELSPSEVKVLDGIYDMINSADINRKEWINRGATNSTLKQVLNITNLDFELSIENLYRLRLCSPPSAKLGFLDNPSHNFQLMTKDIICITELGYQFVTACRSHA